MKKTRSLLFSILASFLIGSLGALTLTFFFFSADPNYFNFLIIVLLMVGAGYYFVRLFFLKLQKNVELLKTQISRFAQGLPFQKVLLETPKEMKALSQELNRLFVSVVDRQETMSRQKHEVEAILQGMIEGVIVLDHQFIIRRINSAAASLFPSSRDHQGLSLIDACRNSALYTLSRNLWENPEGQIDGEIILQDLVTTLSVQGAALADEEGNRWSLVLVFRDITQIKRLESIRKDFVANVSHELRTPLTNIKGYVETLTQGALEDPSNARRFLNIIERQTDRMAGIIEDLLLLSRLENGLILDEAKEVDLEEVVHSALQSCQERVLKRELKLKIRSAPMVVRCHRALMEQALINLLDNGIKFSPTGKSLIVTLEKGDNYALLSVHDQGSGIPEKDKDRIFERFFRTEKGRETEGTGLGLSIVKHIMAIHKGTVSATNCDAGGAVFQLAIPLHL